MIDSREIRAHSLVHRTRANGLGRHPFFVEMLSTIGEAPDVASDPRQYVLKHGDMFLVADAVGNVSGPSEGLFYNDTRMLSRFYLQVGGRALSLLGSAVGQDNVLLHYIPK